MEERGAWLTRVLWVAVVALGIGGLAGAMSLRAGADAAEDQLHWLVGSFDHPPDEDEVRAHVDAGFLGALPARELVAIMELLSADGPHRVAEMERRGPLFVEAVVAGRGGSWDVTLGVGGAGNRIRTFRIEPHVEPYATATSWAGLDAALGRIAPDVGLLAAEVVDGECTTVHEVAADRSLALASVHKLYVLGALGEAVAAGTLGWDQEIPIRAEQRVNGSDRYGDVAPGTKAKVRSLARAMISNSDNTASEVLLDLVGRDAVEEIQGRMGMAHPEANMPFLSLAEWTLLKFGRPPLADEYVALPDAAARRRFVESRLAGRSALQAEVTLLPAPTHLDTVEWFATPGDICRAHLFLQAMATRPGLEPIRSTLREQFTWLAPRPGYTAYKGGSEPGVFDVSFYMEQGGKRYVVVILLRNRQHHFRASAAMVRDAYRLLQKEK